MSKEDYIIELIQFCGRWNIRGIANDVFFFCYHAGIPLDDAKDYMRAFWDAKQRQKEKK